MFKQAHLLCTSLIAVSLGVLHADHPGSASEADLFSNFPSENAAPLSIEAPMASHEPSFPSNSHEVIAPETTTTVKKEKPKGQFKPFTGKVKGKKVRLRTQPDLESSVVRELQRGEYLAIVDEVDDFWVTQAPSDLKAYVFRSFVLDNVVEGNRVNVRLQPNTEAPVITHLNSGDTVQGIICPSNHKWIEIAAPEAARFYISKSYVENIGGIELKQQYDSRLALVQKQLEIAQSFSESEMKKNYNEINFDQMNHNFQIVIQDYADFPSFVEKAKDLLSELQERFIDKRIAYMESKSEQEEENLAATSSAQEMGTSPTDKMKLWAPVEEALYLSWATAHEAQSQADYQLEQKLAAERISGILEPYNAPVKCKPGDYIIRENDIPVGYVYSTVVNLQNLVGKKVSLVGTPRPNNNFAFPAYFIMAVAEE
jgi:hypothetical protein